MNFPKLVQKQLTSNGRALLICKNCFCHFPKKHAERFKVHKERCMLYKPAEVLMPDKNNVGEAPKLQFKNFKHKLRVPFCWYADCESVLIKSTPPENEQGKRKKQKKTKQSETVVVQEHKAMSVGCVLRTEIEDKYCLGLSKEIQIFKGENCIQDFLQHMKMNARKVEQILTFVRPMIPLTQREISDFDACKVCYICLGEIEECDVKVRDHCHISGKYRGAAHNGCNLNFKIPSFVPVFFHNLSGYDAHMLITKLDYDASEIKVIARVLFRFE